MGFLRDLISGLGRSTDERADFEGYESEDEYLRSLKQDDSYHFVYPFEYIAKNHGNDKYDIETAIWM